MDQDKIEKIDSYDLLEAEIEEKYKKQNIKSIIKDFDYDGQENDNEIWLIRIPKNFDQSSLNNEKIELDSKKSEINLKNGWKLTNNDAKQIDNMVPLLPVQYMDGIMAPSTKKIQRYLTVSKKLDTNNNFELAKRMRDEPVEAPKKVEGLTMSFHPVGFFTGEKEIKTELEFKEKNNKEKKSKEKKKSAKVGNSELEVKTEDHSEAKKSKKKKKSKKDKE
ncbi:hypothetical protein K502DRAFT_362442 [Neoconidiobolus thromboides FSU 785]|nr:hypothetical protein K502DRAFT_362442 [Neoconidiobolus thromboides FSU 785]